MVQGFQAEGRRERRQSQCQVTAGCQNGPIKKWELLFADWRTEAERAGVRGAPPSPPPGMGSRSPNAGLSKNSHKEMGRDSEVGSIHQSWVLAGCALKVRLSSSPIPVVVGARDSSLGFSSLPVRALFIKQEGKLVPTT